MNILVLTDNKFIYREFKLMIGNSDFQHIIFDFCYSHNNKKFKKEFTGNFKPINLKEEYKFIIRKYDMVFSLHCKQLFPSELVNSIRCINVHPGLNPYNRGWFPQVFSIINKQPIGATIHEMDEELDHGPIVIQKELKIKDWETSYDIYTRIQELEIELLKDNLLKIININYEKKYPVSDGNINLKKDFDKLCEINLEKKITYKEAIDFFRAVSFKGYKNAYFYDDDGNKIFVEMKLEKEEVLDEQ